MYYSNILNQDLRGGKTYEHNWLEKRSVVDRHRCHMAAMFKVVFVDEEHDKLASFLRYTGYINLIKYHNINHVLLQILVRTLLLNCLYFQSFASQPLKPCY